MATADDRLDAVSALPQAYAFGADAKTFDKVTSGPDVEVASGFEQLGLQPGGVPCTDAPADYFQVRVPAAGTPFGTPRPRLIEGRYADPTAADEAVLSEQHARRLGVGLGDRIRYRPYVIDEKSGEVSGCGSQVVATVKVVGIIREFLEVGSRDEPTTAATYLTPAFMKAHPDVPSIAGGIFGMVRLRPGVRADDFVAHVAEIAPQAEDGSPRAGAVVAEDPHNITAPLDALALGMLVLAIVLVTATTVTVGVAIVRQIGRSAGDLRILLDVGLARRAIAIGVVAPVLLAVVAGVAGAAALALTLSPLGLIGLSRTVDPSTGFDVDATVLVVGLVAGTVALVITAVITAWRAAARAGSAGSERGEARRTVVDRFADRVRSPAAGLGLRFALGGSTRRSRAAPTRAAAAALAVACAGLVSVLWFGVGVRHASHEPSVYGWGDWDAFASPSDTEPPAEGDRRVQAAVLADPDIDRVAAVAVRVKLDVAGQQLTGFAVRPARGRTGPTVVAGRLPVSDREIALGQDAASEVGIGLGDRIRVAGVHRHADLRVVGRVVTPSIDGGPISSGFVVDQAALRALGFGPGCTSDVTEDCYEVSAVSFRSGRDPAMVVRRLSRMRINLDRPKPSANVVLISEADTIPGWAALALAVVASVGLAHALFTTVARRRRDLAITRALGLGPRQAAMIIVTEAMVLGVIGAVVGTVTGVVAGRAAWRAAARAVGIGPDLSVPTGVVVGVGVGVLVLAFAISVVPAWLAARSTPGDGLRAEN
jgi:hypothetical protein